MTIKIETTIKNQMTAFVAENGLTNSDTTTADGSRYLTTAPTRFHFGQVKVMTAESGTWIAEYNQAGKLSTPKQIHQISTGAWALVR
jgi:hypothetical protein